MREPVRLLRLGAVGLLLAFAFGLAACGVKGPLEPPPDIPDSEIRDPAPKDPPPEGAAPERPFVLDPLLM